VDSHSKKFQLHAKEKKPTRVPGTSNNETKKA